MSLQLRYRKLPEPSTRGSGAGGSQGWRPPALPNVNNLALELRAFEFDQRFADRRWLIKRLRKHYMAEVRRQVHKILLHADVAGMVAEHSAFARAGRGVLSTLTGRRGGGAAGAGGGAPVASSSLASGKHNAAGSASGEDGSTLRPSCVRLPGVSDCPSTHRDGRELRATRSRPAGTAPLPSAQAAGERRAPLCCVRAADAGDAFSSRRSIS